MPAPTPPAPPEEEVLSTGSFEGVDLAVVLPTLNEQDGLGLTLADLPLAQLRASGRRVKVLVIDGGSTDRTLEVARAQGLAVLRQRSRGKGAAIREALEWLAARGVAHAVVLDADSTYSGATVPAAVELLEAGSQLVVGVREPVTKPGGDLRELIHRVGNRLLNITASQLAGIPFLDLCSGFWGVSLPTIPSLGLESNGFEIESELFTKAYRAGYTITQIPVAYRERIGIAKLHAVRDGTRILLTTLRFGRRQLSNAFLPPTGSRLRDLLSLAVVSGGDDLRIVVAEARREEAESLARRIRAGRPSARIAVELVPARPGRVEEYFPVAPVPTPARPSRTTTILLPASEPTGSSEPTAYALVHLPRTDRLVAVRPPSSDPVAAAALARSGGFRVGIGGFETEHSPDGSALIERVRAIYANTFPDAAAKELALLGANDRAGSFYVYRPRTRADLVAPVSHELRRPEVEPATA